MQIANGSVVVEKAENEESVRAQREEAIMQLMPEDPVFRKVAEEVVYMRLKTIGPTLMNSLETKTPKDIVDFGLSAGMAIVARLYSDQVYTLPEVMMAVKTMEIGMTVVDDVTGNVRTEVRKKGKDNTDPHNIAKGVGNTLIRANGFEPVDSETEDVPVMVDAVSKYLEVRPRRIPGTILMTSTMTPFPGKRY